MSVSNPMAIWALTGPQANGARKSNPSTRDCTFARIQPHWHTLGRVVLGPRGHNIPTAGPQHALPHGVSQVRTEAVLSIQSCTYPYSVNYVTLPHTNGLRSSRYVPQLAAGVLKDPWTTRTTKKKKRNENRKMTRSLGKKQTAPSLAQNRSLRVFWDSLRRFPSVLCSMPEM